MNSLDLHRLLDEIIAVRGEQSALAALQAVASSKDLALVLTIVANAGVHSIPEQYLRGEVYNASRGNWDASTQESLVRELTGLLTRLGHKLRSRPWKRVYLIPTGHPILSVQIKAMVYRLLRVNTIDLYHKAGTYFEIDIDQRAIALNLSEGP